LLGLADLIDDRSAHLQPSAAQLSEHTAEQKRDIARQRAEAEVRAADEAGADGRATSEAALRKRREREERRAAKLAAQAAAAEANGEFFVADTTPAIPPAALPARPETPASTAAAYAGAYTVHIPATSTALAWYDAEGSTSGAVYETLDAARAAGIWVYPETAAQRARCTVFRDLWEQGYFMGGGIKFGGDWLVYPGISRICSVSDEAHRLQATHCAITHTSLPKRCARTTSCGRWRSLRMAVLAQRRKSRISCARFKMLQTSTRKSPLWNTGRSNGQASAEISHIRACVMYMLCSYV
jgi:hypothetical protein